MGNSRLIEADLIEGLSFEKNFIRNSGEKNANHIIPYQDAAATRPVDGTGGTPAVTVSTLAFNALSDDRSIILTKPNSNVQGQGWSINFNIDRANQARVLKVEFDYNVAAGTFVAGTTSADSDVIVYLYDVTNNRLIEPSTFKLFSNSTTVADKFSGYFQTSADSLDYRLIFHVATTSAVAFDLRVDNLIVTPSKYVFGTPITDWKSYTPTISGLGTGTTSGVSFYWRRVGDTVEITGRWVMATAGTGATFVRASLPVGLSIDPFKIQNDESIGLGSGNRLVGGARTPISVTSGASGVPNTVAFINTNGTFIEGSSLTLGSQVGFEAFVPIQGWSSSVQMSSDVVWVDDVGKVDAFAIPATTPPPGYLFCNGAAVSRTVYADLFRKIGTTHGSGDGSTTFNLPDYRGRFLRGQDTGIARDPDRASRIAMNAGGNTGDNVGSVQSDAFQGHYHEIETRTTADGIFRSGAGANGGAGGTTNNDLRYIAKQTITGVNGAPRTSNETRPINAYVNYFIKFTRHAAPVLAQSEVVSLKASNIVGTALTSSLAVIPYANKIYDTHNAWNGTVFTAPVAGFYSVIINGRVDLTLATAESYGIELRLNGTRIAFSNRNGSGVSSGYSCLVSTELYMTSGQQLDIRQACTGTSPVLANFDLSNHIAITKVG